MPAKIVKKKKVTFGYGLKEVKGKKSKLLAYAPSMKAFVTKNEGVLTATHKLIQEKFEQIQQGKKVVDTVSGITIQRSALTGSYHGRSHNLRGINVTSFKVSAGGKEFFVKAVRMINEKSLAERTPVAFKALNGLRILDSWLKKRKYTVNGFNVRIITPLLLYNKGRQSYLVTRFYNKGAVKQVLDMKGKLANKIISTLDFIKEDSGKTGKFIREIKPKNAFYNHKANTILLYDVNYFEKSS